MFAVFQEQVAGGADLRAIAEGLGWIDASALSVCAVFGIIGIFKGLIWQVSRVAILVAAYYSTVEFGEPLTSVLLDWTNTGPDAPTDDQSTTARIFAYVFLFLFVLVGLSLFALFLQSLARKAGLGFYDRLFGGALGALTGGIVVVVLLSGVMHLLPDTRIAEAAESSHSVRLLKQGIAGMGEGAQQRFGNALNPHHRQRPGAEDGSDPSPRSAVEASGTRDGQPSGSLLPDMQPSAVDGQEEVIEKDKTGIHGKGDGEDKGDH
ncbi:MAG: Colicin production protein [Planctomycetota bacterium]